jgi:hypothetical protein
VSIRFLISFSLIPNRAPRIGIRLRYKYPVVQLLEVSLSTTKDGIIRRMSFLRLKVLTDADGRNDDGTPTGQSQTYSFILQYWTPGMGLFLATSDNSTSIQWNLDGSLSQPNSTSSASISTSTSPSAITSGYEGREIPLRWILTTLALSTLALRFAST